MGDHPFDKIDPLKRKLIRQYHSPVLKEFFKLLQRDSSLPTLYYMLRLLQS